MSKVPFKGEPFYIDNGFIKYMNGATGEIELVADFLGGVIANYDKISPEEKAKHNSIIELLNLGFKTKEQL